MSASEGIRLKKTVNAPEVTDIIPERAGFNYQRNRPSNSVVVKRRYVNYSGLSLIVQSRDGVKIVLRPSNPDLDQSGEYQAPVLKVCIEYQFNMHMMDNITVPFAEEAGETLGRDAKLIFEILHRERGIAANRGNPQQPITIALEYTVDPMTIRESGGGVYLETLDIVVSEDDGEIRLHPYSPMGKYDRELRERAQEVKGFCFGLTIVDNVGTQPYLYTRYAGQVIKIKPIRDPNRKSGVYVCLQGVTIGPDAQRDSNGVSYFEFGDIAIKDMLNLRPTYSEALNCEDTKDTVQREHRMREDEKKHQQAMAQREFDEKLLQMKLDHANKQAENVDKQVLRDEEKFTREQRLEADRTQAELENQNQKKKYDRENHDMAMQREWIRFIGPAVGAIAAIVTTVLTIVQLRAKQEKLLGLVSHLAPRLFSFGLGLFA